MNDDADVQKPIEKPWLVTLHYADEIGMLTMRVEAHTHASIAFTEAAAEYCGGATERDDDGYIVKCAQDYIMVETAREIARLSALG